MFRPELDAALNYSAGARGGRPPFDPVMMFKILVIQAQSGLSDDRAEFLINDRLSFMRLLGLGLSDKVPDAKTIWAFRERLTQAGTIEALFTRFDRAICAAGYIPMSGQIVDASLVAAPKQRNTAAEKAEIKTGRVPEGGRTSRRSSPQKNRDARWTLVFGRAREREDGTHYADIAIPVFGYKGHASIDRRHGFIRRWAVTDASAPKGRMLRRGLLDKSNSGATVWADSAYRSRANEAFIERHGFKSQVHHPQATRPADAAPHPARQRRPLQGSRRD